MYELKPLSLPLLLAVLILVPGPSAGARQGRLPPQYEWGRCLLQVEGTTYISGRCAYHIRRGGSFEAHGPRQTYAGIHYPEPALHADEVSTDWFVQVDVEGRSAQAFMNEHLSATHAHRWVGPLTRQGACWINARTRICLWRR